MKITEILVESQQLDEGPFGTAVGKAVGGLAKGVGAVAGGVAGMGRAFKKGYSSGKATASPSNHHHIGGECIRSIFCI